MSANIKARVSTQMAYKAKREALLEVEGSIRYQFARLKDYGSELKRVDPETTIDIKCDFSNSSKEPLFKRMYICLYWCRAFFNTSVNCDIMDNNLCESFNGWLVEARKKPLVTMFEEIRVKLMKRIQMRKEKMEALQGNIYPKPRKVLEKNKIKVATDYIPTFNGGDEAEVENIEGAKNVVNMRHRTCNCRRWDLIGIACKHAISAIHLRRHDPYDYVANCYLKKTYLAIYNNLIRPVNSMDLWQRSDDPPILPSQYSRQPGRPKTKRIKDASENAPSGDGKLGKQQRSLSCGNCGQTKKGKKCPLTANQLRMKAKERAEYQRKKLVAAKAAKLATNRSAHTTSASRPQQAASRPTTSRTQPTSTAPTSSRPPQASTSSTNKAATSTRSSQRIMERSGTGDGN
ncbi:uncharacterized protein LOC112199326 [Rosa chinensis]|uniref:uncharacterized protein LOC112199326 n=1 Tax=Rosa chinensis TaxID=74649 RepID=UPI000D08ED5A|nr:uncharacterized protein LOC112199326 [Rosa chinensis]